MPTSRTKILAALAVIAFAGGAYAQGAPSKAEQTLKYRQSVYQVIAWNFGPMGAMAQGKMPYDAKEFALRAERVAAAAPLLGEAYTAATKGIAKSNLKPEMWANRADFDDKLQALIDRSASLAATAQSGDFEKSKAAFFETANTCKSCHDKYKAD